MSKFFEDLWESIFTPGPTPALLVATNVTFAVLQVVLFVLLIATYSIHFVVLSILSGSLWWAVNWFARELQVAQQLQEAALEEEKRKDRRRAAVAAATAASAASTDGETKVEGTEAADRASARTTGAQSRSEARQRLAVSTQTADTQARQTSQGGQSIQERQGSSQHLASSRSGVSTEDEWEKVSEDGN
ncbi:SMK killer toxin resistance protein [Sporothrix epigloea]|uniref:SMK killer toxin resistance protein n=1 Tax=Sporothrix epigloea TaxID=1892477 RepID=A0ABP0DSV9_9PEZI